MFTKAEKHTVLAASCLSVFVNPLAGSMLNLALSAIQADFGCSEHQLGWVASIYFIVSVMCLLPLMSTCHQHQRMLNLWLVIGR